MRHGVFTTTLDCEWSLHESTRICKTAYRLTQKRCSETAWLGVSDEFLMMSFPCLTKITFCWPILPFRLQFHVHRNQSTLCICKQLSVSYFSCVLLSKAGQCHSDKQLRCPVTVRDRWRGRRPWCSLPLSLLPPRGRPFLHPVPQNHLSFQVTQSVPTILSLSYTCLSPTCETSPSSLCSVWQMSWSRLDGQSAGPAGRTDRIISTDSPIRACGRCQCWVSMMS